MTDLQQAVDLIKAGQTSTARRIVLQELRTNQDNIKAWLCLTRCAADREQFEISVRNVLRLDPSNEYGRKLAAKHDIELYSSSADLLQAEQLAEEAQRKAREVDSALENISDVLDPVQPAQRVTRQRRRKDNTTLPNAYLGPGRRLVLRFIQTVGLLALIGIGAILGLAYIDSQEADLTVAEQETRDAIEVEAATVFRENTLSVATVAVRATVFAGTETAIAIETTIIADAEILFLGTSRIETGTVFAPQEPIGVRFRPGERVDPSTLLELRVVDTSSGEVVQTQEVVIGEGRRNVRIQPPSSGWGLGEYTVELYVDNAVIVTLAAEVTADGQRATPEN
jgi:hypothetical protein